MRPSRTRIYGTSPPAPSSGHTRHAPEQWRVIGRAPNDPSRIDLVNVYDGRSGTSSLPAAASVWVVTAPPTTPRDEDGYYSAILANPAAHYPDGSQYPDAPDEED